MFVKKSTSTSARCYGVLNMFRSSSKLYKLLDQIIIPTLYNVLQF